MAPLILVIVAAAAAPTPLSNARPVSAAPPAAAPTLRCDNQGKSGGQGVTTRIVELGRSSGTFLFSWDTMAQPDAIVVSYQGGTLLSTGKVSGKGSRSLSYSGGSSQITVTVTGTGNGTGWYFKASCPIPPTPTPTPTRSPTPKPTPPLTFISPRQPTPVTAEACRQIPWYENPLSCRNLQPTGTWTYKYDGCSFSPDAPLGATYHDQTCPATGPSPMVLPKECQSAPCDLHDACYQTCGNSQSQCDNLLRDTAIRRCPGEARARSAAYLLEARALREKSAQLAARAISAAAAAKAAEVASAREVDSAHRIASTAQSFWEAKSMELARAPWLTRFTLAIEVARAAKAATAAWAAWAKKVVVAKAKAAAAQVAATARIAAVGAVEAAAKAMSATSVLTATRAAQALCETVARRYHLRLTQFGEWAFKSRQREVCRCCG